MLRDGRRVSGEADDFEGCPERPLSEAALARKVRALTGGEVALAALLG